LCAAIPRDSAVVIIDRRIADNFTQLVRGMCGVPVARADDPGVRAISDVVRSIRRSGHRPVLLGARSKQLKPFGATPRRIMALRTTQDSHTLINPPRATWNLTVNIWMSEPSR
jgi:hypothetical protein